MNSSLNLSLLCFCVPLFCFSLLFQNSCWFDLSPRNIERKLGTKAEIAKLVHMVFKVASELAPSVIYIDDADRVFQTVKSKKNVPEVVKMKSFIMTHKAMLTRQVR